MHRRCWYRKSQLGGKMGTKDKTQITLKFGKENYRQLEQQKKDVTIHSRYTTIESFWSLKQMWIVANEKLFKTYFLL